MDNLQQIVVQLTTAPMTRALAQYGTDFIPSRQNEIIYEELKENEQKLFDDFVELVKSKSNQP